MVLNSPTGGLTPRGPGGPGGPDEVTAPREEGQGEFDYTRMISETNRRQNLKPSGSGTTQAAPLFSSEQDQRNVRRFQMQKALEDRGLPAGAARKLAPPLLTFASAMQQYSQQPSQARRQQAIRAYKAVYSTAQNLS